MRPAKHAEGRRPRGHLTQLDGLRGLAVLAVVLQHNLPSVAVHTLEIGGAGVRLFFVLSGFLITRILLQARDQLDAGRRSLWSVGAAFYARRALRIFPLYYAVLGAAALGGLPGVRDTLLWQGCYLSNHYVARLGHWPDQPLSHLWSLSVEEQFYLVWPAVVLLGPRRWLGHVFLATVVAAPCCRFALLQGTHNLVSPRVLTLSCVDTLGAGALLALTSRATDAAAPARRQLLRGVALPLGLGVFGALVVLRFVGRGATARIVVGDTALLLVFVWLVDRAATGFGGRVRSVLEFRPLTYLGTISYGVYLYHDFVPPLLRLLRDDLRLDIGFPDQLGPVKLLYVVALTVPIAALSWHVLERPLNDLKRYFPCVSEAPASARDSSAAEVPQCAALPQASAAGALRTAIWRRCTRGLAQVGVEDR
jgi:peptidoglycan/LPS O-acetylase OafA/YrhL